MQVTSFVGREREIAEGVKLFQQARVLTLTGPGGTGKTRLSLQIAAQVADQFPGGVTFVALAPISDPELVAPAIVEALHLEAGSAPPRDRLLQHFRDRQALLVMDNFEQVLAAATLVADLIRASPGLKVIVSSRGALRISGEQEMPVPPLALPDPGAPADAQCRSTRRCGCSSSARRRGQAGVRGRPTRTPRRSPRSARAWTGCRWRSSWPRRASSCCRPRRS